MSPRKKDKNVKRFPFKIVELLLLIIGVLIVLISILTWMPREESEIMFKVNFLSLAIGILYILFAVVLRKAKF